MSKDCGFWQIISRREEQTLHSTMGSLNHELQLLQGNHFPEDSVGSTETQVLRKEGRISRKLLIFAFTVVTTGIICLVVGIAFLRMKESQNDNLFSTTINPTENARPQNNECSIQTSVTPNFTESCSFSREFKESGLLGFIQKLNTHFYQLHPYEVPYRPHVTPDEVRNSFKAFDPAPSSIKKITDTSKALLQELKTINFKAELMKAREVKAVAKMNHFLQHSFGNVYDFDYYSGQWMLGPNRFCYTQIIARLPYHFRAFLKKLSPHTVEDLETIIEALKSFSRGIRQYHENVKLGVKTGMVGSIEECKVGLHCLSQVYPKIAEGFREEDVILESFRYPFLTHQFLMRFENASGMWFKKHGVHLEQSMVESLISHIGVPLANLFKYLADDHLKHCVPSNVSSGLFNRPVRYVYKNGVPNVSEPASRRLPTGELIDGKSGYERTMRFFTTTNDTAESVHQLGWSMLRSLYPKAVDIAKTLTGKENTSEAVRLFRQFIHSPSMYFNEEPFPKNESNDKAHRKCNSEAGARKFCPHRYAAMQRWFDFSRSTLSQLEPKLLRMFHWPLGPRKTTPVCPVEVAINFTPSTSAQSYTSSSRSCSQPAWFRMPFFLDRMGPKYSEWTTSAHEARPGHHLQSQGYVENFLDWCGPLVSALVKTRYIAYSEGWALYAENPLISMETDVYDENPLRFYGMLKWQIWRALRLIVDTGLHFKGMSREQAIQLFRHYAWDDTDVAGKEVTRYQSGPGQATAYMIGQRAFIDMRENAERRLGSKFDIRDFHYHLLSHGPAPLSYITKRIDNYVECTLNKTYPECRGYFAFEYERKLFSQNQGYNDGIEWDHLEEFYFPPEIHEF